MICKMNEMEMNNEMNELDFGTWNDPPGDRQFVSETFWEAELLLQS